MPICPHCEAQVPQVTRHRAKAGLFWATYMFTCPACDKILGAGMFRF